MQYFNVAALLTMTTTITTELNQNTSLTRRQQQNEHHYLDKSRIYSKGSYIGLDRCI